MPHTAATTHTRRLRGGALVLAVLLALVALPAPAHLRLPVFFQVGADDFDASRQITEVLYQAGNREASRVVEARVPGSGLAQFRADPQLARRFLAWLDAALGAPGATRATRPS